MKLRVISLLAFALIGFGGCMPFRYFPLPVSPSEARSTFAPIATAASNAGYKQWQWDDSVSFEANAHTRVSYMFGASGNYVMCVQLKRKDVPGGIEAAIAAGKAIGDQVWNAAMALRVAPMLPAAVEIAPAPGVQINITR